MKNINFVCIPIVLLTLLLETDRVLGAIRIFADEEKPLSVYSQIQTDRSNRATLNSQERDLERQAQDLYETGQFAKAIQVLQQAIAHYNQQGEVYFQAIAFRNLALVELELGRVERGKEALNRALDLIQSLDNERQKQQAIAQVLEVKGKLQLSTGEAEAALETWKQATDLYRELDNLTGVTRGQINQVAALRSLGLYARASKQLQELQQTLQQQPDTLLKVQALQSLGDVLRAVGKLEEAEAVLKQSLTILEGEGAEASTAKDRIASVLMSLGQTIQFGLSDRAKTEEIQKVLDYYQRAASVSSSLQIQVQAQLNQFGFLIDRQQFTDAIALLPGIQAKLEQLPPNRTATYARINFAHRLMQLHGENVSHSLSPTEIAQYLVSAVQTSENLGDKRTEAYALGSLGTLYEQNQRWDEAKDATEQALLVARGINAADIAYQWQWQLGRILCQDSVARCPPEQQKSAIAAYSRSVSLLQTLRSDLLAISSDVQYSFRDRVEPIYRELVSLLLQPPDLDSPLVKASPIDSPLIKGSEGGILQDNLKQAREVIELLHLAELDNFFQDACLDAKPVQLDRIDPDAAVLYPIILSDRVALEERDRLEVIAALPGQPLRHYTASLPQGEIETVLKKLRNDLATYSFNPERLQRSQQVYNWLIRPLERELQQHRIKTLAFVPDGLLRNIPIAALYDGQQYVVEKYSIAFAPTLNLIDPQPLPREVLHVLSAGLTEARQGFSPLPNVELELDRIQAEVPARILLDRTFTEANFKAQVNSATFPVVHLATHGEFSSRSQDTFLLTWDDKINIEELNALLQSDLQQKRPIELLVLSACQTAAGDDRAALGLAGMAVRAGARSTLASLWYISDEATSILMTRFYQELAAGNVTKAEALRRAQVEVLNNDKFSHPYFWSAFVLVGNWL